MNFTFWCVLADGRHNSVSTNNMTEAKQRARALGASRLFCKNPSTGKTFEMHF